MSRNKELVECPKCSSKLDVKREEKQKKIILIHGNPDKGGYYGEREEEYCVSGYGDQYTTITVIVTIYNCPKCGYKVRREPHGDGPGFSEETDF